MLSLWAAMVISFNASKLFLTQSKLTISNSHYMYTVTHSYSRYLKMYRQIDRGTILRPLIVTVPQQVKSTVRYITQGGGQVAYQWIPPSQEGERYLYVDKLLEILFVSFRMDKMHAFFSGFNNKSVYFSCQESDHVRALLRNGRASFSGQRQLTTHISVPSLTSPRDSKNAAYMSDSGTSRYRILDKDAIYPQMHECITLICSKLFMSLLLFMTGMVQ